MDFKRIEEEERILQQKQAEFLKLAKEICVLKKKTNDLDIEIAAKERELEHVKESVIDKQIELDLLKGQVAFLEEICKHKSEEEESVLAATQEAKKKLWGKYKALVKLAEDEAANMKECKRETEDSKREQPNEVTRNVTAAAELEAMREFLAFQDLKKAELQKIIADYDLEGRENV